MTEKKLGFFRKKDVVDDVYRNPRNRDVYDSQVTDRGDSIRPISAGVRVWGSVITCLTIFVGTWAIITGAMAMSNGFLVSMNISNDNLPVTFMDNLFVYWPWKLLASGGLTLIVGGLVALKLWRNYQTQNAFNDHRDINQYENDQHIALPMETMTKFEWFPDVGAHASPQVSSMISHVMLSNKGIDMVEAAQFYSKKDEKESGGQVLAGEHKLDEDGEIIFKKMPFFDKEFGEALFEASGITDKLKNYKKYYDATTIPYMPDSPRDAVGGGKYKTVADVINADWELPYYEPQRPAGAYLVDVAPVIV